ncbi:KaiC domain-containing protein [Natrinema sp. HArc-T2]|uniref:KaiC domain-containing protein n=1 Tax=Natrinema sp. HArc-T2 TaxID=3242701 RepID=UPI00359D9B75
MVAVGDEDDWFDRALEDEDEDGDESPTTDEGEADGDDGALFDDDFDTALRDVGPPVDADDDSDDPVGPAGFDDLDFVLGGDEPDFDAELDSDLPRLDLGIDGLDRMIQGGVPERSLIVVMGSAGTGKTTFGLQFLHHGLEHGERAVFITLEESRDRVISSATEKGYAFDEYVADRQLAVVDVDPIEMANSLASIRNELPALVEEFGASRLVLDSVSLLEMMYEDRAKRRNEIYDFARSLKDAGVTALLTSEAAAETAYASRYGIVEYLTDAVMVLQYVRPDDFRETRMAVEIQKIRDANHSREKKPYEITPDGISVHQQANLF